MNGGTFIGRTADDIVLSHQGADAMPDWNRRRLLYGLAGLAVTPMVLSANRAFAAGVRPDAASALVVVDVQNCFLPGGSLAVKEGDQVIPVINRIAKAFENVILTQDWHTPGHISFASSHPGKKPFEVVR